MERQEKLERVALTYFAGLPVDYHRRMAGAMVHALTNWVPTDHVDDALNDVRYFSEQILKKLEEDIHRSRYNRDSSAPKVKEEIKK